MTERLTRALPVVIAIVLIAGLLAAGALPVPVLVLSIPFLVILWRAPVLRRLAVRNATRRPRETALILVGSLLGTAIITGSLVVGDTLRDSIQRFAYTQLGPVDEVIATENPAQVPAIERAVSTLPATDVDGVLPLTEVGVVAAAGLPPADPSSGAAAGAGGAAVAGGAAAKAEPHAEMIETDFAKARAFGGNPAATGMSGPTPTGSDVAIGADLAHTLGVHVGSPITIYAYGEATPFRVIRVLPRIGVAGLFGVGNTSPNVFAAPGTIARLRGPAAFFGIRPLSVVAVSNKGGVIAGAALSDRVGAEITSALGPGRATVRLVKQDLLKNSKAAGKQFTQLFGGIGFFSVLAGILLLVNIFVMLAQERKTELGMLRAVGLRRSRLVGSFSLEGWMYALASAALGTVAGLGVGRLIVVVASGIFAGRGRFALNLQFSAHAPSLQGGFTIGFLISLVTVVLTSLGIARLNVIRAIRDLPDPERGKPRRAAAFAGAALALVGLALTVSGISNQSGVPVLLGPGLIGVGLEPALRQFLPRRPVISITAVAVMGWAVSAFTIVPGAFNGGNIPVFVTQGMVLTFAAVALVSTNQDAIGAVIRRIGGGSRNMSLRLGLAYPLAKRLRTALILASYVLVVFILTFITLFSHMFGSQVNDFTRKISGGFALRVDSSETNPITPAQISGVPGVTAVAPIAIVFGEFRGRLSPTDFKTWEAATFDRRLIDQGPPALTKRGTFPDDAAAYRSLLTDPQGLIVSSFFLQNGSGPPKGVSAIGDPYVLRDPVTGKSETLHITAIAEAGFGNQLALISPAAMRAVFGDRAVVDELFVATKPGVDPAALATRVNGQFVANGADAASFRSTVEQNLGQQEQFFHLMQGYIALGLLVGIAGLGVVMIRAVRERRRQIGVLRSLGFESKAVRRAFTAESAFVSLEGVILGAGLACVTAWRLAGSKGFGATLHFSIPWLQLGVLVVAAFVASLIATAVPAVQASKIRPAVALRIAD